MKDGGGTYKVASAAIKLNSDGSAVLFTGTVEIGQGCRTALAQVAAEELSLPYEAVTVAQLDTDSTPYDAATNASSSMVIMGLCVVRAAAELKKQLRHAAAKLFGCKADKITFKNGHVSAGKGKRLSYEQVLNRKFGAKGGELLAKGTYQDVHSKKAVLGSPTTFWETSWGGAEVEVDPDTGVVKLLKYISTADVGKAIHPLQCEGQDEGAVMFAIGHSLMEEMQYDNGHLLNPNLIDYRLPSFTDIPGTFKTILVEDGNGPGPYGAKGLGEGGLMPVAPGHRQRHRRRRRRAHARASRHPGEDVARDAGERLTGGSEGSFTSLVARRRQCSSAFKWITTNAWLTSTWHSRT